MMHRTAAFLLGLLALLGTSAFAETYYVAPLGAVIVGTPDGSEARPFASLTTAFASKKINGGDTILLKDGSYGDVVVKGQVFATPVTIASQNGLKAELDSLLVASGSRNLVFRTLSVWPRDPAKGKLSLVRAYSDTSDITIDSFVIKSDKDADKFMSWDAAKWEARKFNGISLEGARSLAVRNLLTAVNMGVMLGGADSTALSNTVNGFNGDGLRGTGDNNTFRFNRVFNCVKTNANHDDGFQSFPVGSVSVKGLVFDSNVIVEWTGGSHPLRCMLQGIGMFDGFYDNVTITNNLILVTAYHGLSIYGARSARITNNTVVNGLSQTSRYPWIAVMPHKNGTPSSDVLVVNNLGMSFLGATDPAKRIEFRSNSVIGTPGAVFQNPTAFDYRPKATSGYIDTADAAAAPPRDLLNQKRPGGVKPDRGAYETQVNAPSISTATLLTIDGGSSSATTPPTARASTGAKWIRVPKTR